MLVLQRYFFRDDFLRNILAKYKDKATDASDSSYNIGISCNLRLNSTKHKDMYVKGTEKLAKHESLCCSPL